MLVGERIAMNHDWIERQKKLLNGRISWTNGHKRLNYCSMRSDPNFLVLLFQFLFQHHTHIITLKIPQILNLSYASGNSYYYNIAKNQKCGRKLSESGKRRSSKLLVIFQELLRNHSSFLHACHTWSTLTCLFNILTLKKYDFKREFSLEKRLSVSHQNTGGFWYSLDRASLW